MLEYSSSLLLNHTPKQQKSEDGKWSQMACALSPEQRVLRPLKIETQVALFERCISLPFRLISFLVILVTRSVSSMDLQQEGPSVIPQY